MVAAGGGDGAAAGARAGRGDERRRPRPGCGVTGPSAPPPPAPPARPPANRRPPRPRATRLGRRGRGPRRPPKAPSPPSPGYALASSRPPAPREPGDARAAPAHRVAAARLPPHLASPVHRPGRRLLRSPGTRSSPRPLTYLTSVWPFHNACPPPPPPWVLQPPASPSSPHHGRGRCWPGESCSWPQQEKVTVTAWKVGCPASAPAALLHSGLDTPALEGDIPGQAAKAKPLDSGPSFL